MASQSQRSDELPKNQGNILHNRLAELMEELKDLEDESKNLAEER